jgi:hypothetical protein
MSERTCPCGRAFTPRTGTQRFCCAEHRVRYHAQRRAAQEPARYGSQHQKLRRALAREVAAGGVLCVRCGESISPLEGFDLDHADKTGNGYLGAAHISCNRGHLPPQRRVRARLNLDENGTFEDEAGYLWHAEPTDPKSVPQRVSRRW